MKDPEHFPEYSEVLLHLIQASEQMRSGLLYTDVPADRTIHLPVLPLRSRLKHSGTKNPFSITKIDTWHDPEQGALRGPNRIHILESDGLKIAHMGDIGCPLIREQKDLLKHLDAILIPVGGYYTIDAAQAKTVVDDLAPRIVIPMHYRSDHFGYPVIGRLEEFTGLCRNVVEYDSNTLVLTAETRPQTAVLKLK